jgi:hypothetical protein
VTARKLTPLERAEIAAMKARGKTSAAIAVAYSVSSDAVRRIAKKLAGNVQQCAPMSECPAASGFSAQNDGFEVGS